jgi:isopentenyl diphosphate isomerase/L-lactate dehydrogenase-like FMN-dependent dehydrogenase
MTKGLKFDQEKLWYNLIDPEFEEDIAKVATFGLKKYGELNWQKVENGSKRYFNALRRHLKAWEKGEKIDPETKLSHLSHAAWNCMALSWFDKQTKKRSK